MMRFLCISKYLCIITLLVMVTLNALTDNILYYYPVMILSICLVVIQNKIINDRKGSKWNYNLDYELLLNNFTITHELRINQNNKFLVDDTIKKFAIATNKEFMIFNYSDLIDYELIEKEKVIKRTWVINWIETIGWFLGLGLDRAITLSSERKVYKNTLSSIFMHIKLKGSFTPELTIPILNWEAKKNSTTYTIYSEIAVELDAILYDIHSN